MRSKETRIEELEQAAQSMVQGSLSEITRQCGDPSCGCAHDPAKRHGPHLYLKFTAEGKTYSVYVPAQLAPVIKSAHAAWLRFQELGLKLAAANRARLLRDLQREKQALRAKKDKLRSKTQ
jgi:Family of unknown function (DUF6788)